MAVSKPSANVAGAGWSNPANAYDQTYGNESVTFATGVRTRSIIGSSSSTLVLTTFVDPGGLVPKFINVRMAYTAFEDDGAGSFVAIRYSVNSGVDWTEIVTKMPSDIENSTGAYVYQADITGATIANVEVDVRITATSLGDAVASMNCSVYDVWISDGTTARAECSSFLGF